MKLRTFESFDHSDLKNTGDFEIFESNQAYHEWEDDVIRHIEELCDCTRSDAQGIVMAQEYIMAQSWGDNMSAEQTAILIDRASLSEGVRQTIASDGIIIGHGSSKNKTAKEIKKLLAGIDVTLSFEDETKDGKPNMVIKYAQFDKAAKTSRGGLVGRKMKSVKSILGKLDASDKEVKIYSDWKPWRKKVNEDHSEESYNDVITDGIDYVLDQAREKKFEQTSEIVTIFQEYLKSISYRFSDMESMMDATDDVVHNVCNRLNIQLADDITPLSDFKERHGEPTSGKEWTIDVGAPGTGRIKYSVMKVQDGKVFSKEIENTVRDLTIEDVM